MSISKRNRTYGTLGIGLCAGALAALAACSGSGSGSTGNSYYSPPAPPAVGHEPTTPPADPSPTTTIRLGDPDAGTTIAQKDPAGVLNAQCATATANAKREPVYMLVVLDASGSMADEAKWAAVGPALDSFIDATKNRGDNSVALGLTIFSGSGDANTEAARESGTATYTAADVPVGAVDDARAALLHQRLAAVKPDGGTPTFQVIRDQLAVLGAFAPAAPLADGGKKVLVFMTDGVPDPNVIGPGYDLPKSTFFEDPTGQGYRYASKSQLGTDGRTLSFGPGFQPVVLPDGSQISLADGTNLVIPAGADQQLASIDAASAARAMGIQTFAVGIGEYADFRTHKTTDGSLEYDPTFMGALATAGGTAAPGCNPAEESDVTKMCHFQVTPAANKPAAALEADFATAIDKIRATVISCEFKLDQTSANLDPTKVNVVYTDGAGKDSLILEDMMSGWTFDDVGAPTKVILHGGACDRAKSDPDGKVKIVVGCQSEMGTLK